MSEVSAPVSLPARLLRAGLLVGLAAGPAAWLLLPALLRPGVLPGAPSAGIYPLLHRWWATGSQAPPRFPEPGAEPAPELLAWIFRPLVAGLGPASAVTVAMFIGFLATLVVTWVYTRRHAGNEWTAAAATAAFTTSPAVVAGVTSGDLEVWHGWALVALPLARGPAAIAVGVLIAVVAPTLLPAALPLVLLAVFGGERSRWPLAGWAVGVALTTAVGWPIIESGAGYEAWFALLTPAPAPERVYQVYVGFAAAALLLLAAAGSAATRAWLWVALAALAGALVTAPVPPERFLHLVPLAAALGGLGALRQGWPGVGPAAAVFVATALVGEGWRGVAAPVPLVTAALVDPAPVTELADGPVLDLPATRGAIRRGLWFQVHHGQPIAADADGLVTAAVADATSQMAAGTCVDVAALGFHTVVARREGALRELAGLRSCLGDPSWDDGAVAVWRLGQGVTSAVPEAP